MKKEGNPLFLLVSYRLQYSIHNTQVSNNYSMAYTILTLPNIRMCGCQYVPLVRIQVVRIGGVFYVLVRSREN